jgi:predicted nucleotidyltransferase
MARGNYRQFLQTDTVKIKKYFYVLRPVMACMWIEKYQESPPVEFEKLLAQISCEELADAIKQLILRKKADVELGLEPRIAVINNFIEEKLQYYAEAASAFNSQKKPEQKLLEEGFIKIIDHGENIRCPKTAHDVTGIPINPANG